MTHADPPEGLSDRLGWTFTDPGLCRRALAHRSWCAEHSGEDSNERLEFLGDAVLGMVITDQLVRRHPDRSEGWLSRARSDLVRAGTLYAVARELDLGAAVRLGRGEERTGGRDKPSILADAVEALIGAVYLDGGIEAATSVVIGLFGARLDDLDQTDTGQGHPAPSDHKSRLQELCARGGGEAPVYDSRESGPEHAKEFTAYVRLGGRLLATGTGGSKKTAEQAAAAAALKTFPDRTTPSPETGPGRRRPTTDQPRPPRAAAPRNEVKSG